MDATTFTTGTPNSDSYYGTQNENDPTGQWVHSWGASQFNLPDHSHTSASFETEVVVNVDPNSGLSLTSGTQDDGYIYVKFTGSRWANPSHSRWHHGGYLARRDGVKQRSAGGLGDQHIR